MWGDARGCAGRRSPDRAGRTRATPGLRPSPAPAGRDRPPRRGPRTEAARSGAPADPTPASAPARGGFVGARTPAVASGAVATDPPADLTLTPLTGEARTLREWVTTFHLALVVLDPYTSESAWILPTAGRIFHVF